MKIKKFTASDMSLLLNLVKEELGDDAVIISTSRLSDGQTELIAALDAFDDDLDTEDGLCNNTLAYNDSFLRECIAFHQPSSQAQAAILSACRQVASESKYTADKDILAQAFDRLFRYGDFFDLSRPVKMFMGAHGSGKTTALVKAAAMAQMRGIPVCIVGTDTVRAGADSQLQAFADILEAEYHHIRNSDVLFDRILAAQSNDKLVLIDTMGINPFHPEDVTRLRTISDVVSCDKVMMLDAGWNAEDAVEAADVFVGLGAEWVFPSKMDAGHRIGAVLSVAALCGMQLGYAGVSSDMSNGLAAVSSRALTALITE